MQSSKPASVFPTTVGRVNKGGYWKIVLRKEPRCVYYDLKIMEDGIPKYLRKPGERKKILFKYESRLGAGGGGLALQVLDVHTSIALKVALNDFLSIRERTTGVYINRWMLLGRRSPNFVASLFELVCQGLPPAERDWKKIVNEMRRDWVPKFLTRISEPSFRDKPAAISYMGLELGTSGDLFDFAYIGLGHDIVASLSFQLFFGLAVLHENNMIHRDMRDENIVISEVKTSHAYVMPLYRLKYYEDTEWIYADPYLTTLSRAEKNSVVTGQEAHLNFTLKFIDYSEMQRLPAKKPHVILVERLGGAVEVAAPEILFVDRTKKSGPASAPFGTWSELWGAGLIMASLALGGDHIFMDPDNDQLGPGIKPWLLPAPKVVLKAMRSIYKSSKRMYKYMNSQVRVDNGIHLMWNMVEALGLPTEENFPGITKSKLYKTIVSHDEYLTYGMDDGWIRGNTEGKYKQQEIEQRTARLLSVLGIEGRSLLFDYLLVWDTKKRPPAFHIAAQHKYFNRIRKSGNIRNENFQYKSDNVWGFREKWWGLHEKEARVDKNKQQQKTTTKNKQKRKKEKEKD